MRKFLLFIGVCVFGIGVWFIGQYIINTSYEGRAEGYVESVDRYRASVSYRIGDAYYTIQQIQTGYEVGSEVTIWYDVEEPAKAVIEFPVDTWKYYCGMVMVGLILMWCNVERGSYDKHL